MNPILSAAVGSVLRHILTGWAAVLVAEGIWTQADAEKYVGAAAIALIGFGWALYQKYKTHQKIEKALALPQGSTLGDLHRS